QLYCCLCVWSARDDSKRKVGDMSCVWSRMADGQPFAFRRPVPQRGNMARIGENHFTRFNVVSEHERCCELSSVCAGKKRGVKFLTKERLVPGIQVFTEPIPQSVRNGTDKFAVPCHIGQDDTRDSSFAANRHVMQVAALASRRQWPA